MSNLHKKRNRSLEANNRVMKIMLVTGISLTLVVANVLFTMFSGYHFRSGKDVLAYKSGSGTMTEKIIANRGYIYDCNKEIIAQDIEAFDLVAVVDDTRINATDTPAYVVDVDDTCNKLSKIIGCEAKELKKYITSAQEAGMYQTEFGFLGKALTAAQKEEIDALKLPGIEFMDSTDRVYPIGTFASQLVGYAQYNYDDEKISGVMGLEKFFDKELSGTDGEVTYKIDSDGDYLPSTKVYTKTAVNGSDIYLTIDKNVQLVVEDALKTIMEENDANSAMMIVMDLKTGKILAQAGYPTFDLNDRNDIENYRNSPSVDTLELGSVIKPFVYAAAMEEGVYNGNAKFDSGRISLTYNENGKLVQTDDRSNAVATIHDALGKDWGNITFDEGLIRSSNTAIVDLLTKYLDPDVNLKYLEKFGFFNNVGIYGMEESTGLKADTNPLSKITAGFGQGIGVTGYQMVQAASAIFNDGKTVKPYIIDRIVDPNTGKSTYVGNTEKSEQILSEDTVQKLQTLLKKVVTEDYGTAHYYEMSDVTLMGKTGTGETVIDGKYSNEIYNTSFLAAAPAEDPELVFFYTFQSANYRYYKTSPFQKVVREALLAVDKYNDASTQTSEKAPSATFSEYTMPSLINHSISYANDKLKAHTKNIVKIGDGNSIVSQYPSSGSATISNQQVFLLTDGTSVVMPDMSGWTRKDVEMFAKLSGYKITIKGSGHVNKQNVKKETTLKKDTKIVVELK